MSFFKTGTRAAVDVTGFRTNIEDVERGGTTREWLIGPKIVSNGVARNLSFSDSSIFTLPASTWGVDIGTKTVSGESLSRAVPGYNNEGGTQAGKTVGIDLSNTPLSYFRIGEQRNATNAGSVLMGPIGDISMVPEPSSILVIAGGLMSMLCAVRRRKS
jgi:hypothetical protein